jgi:hypothetical protein
VFAVLLSYALELKNTVHPDFTVPATWREEFYRRLKSQGVVIDHAQYEQAGAEIDKLLGNRVARLAFGDSTAKRRTLLDDTQLLKAISVLRQSSTQRDLLALAVRQQQATVRR